MAERAARARRAKNLATTKTVEPGPGEVRPAPSRQFDVAREFAVECARILDSDHCEEIVVLDLCGVSPVCDFFVIATGTSDRQMRAACDHIEVMAKARGDKPFGVAGYESGDWIVADYVDVVIHLFDGGMRSYYDLESLWGDRPTVDWNTQ